MEKLRMALIGAGGIAGAHARRSQGVKNLEITAVVDIDETRARALAEKLGGPRVFTRYEDALAAGGFEAVDICLPTHLHAPVAVAAASRGLHVLCEKPMARTLEQARQMIKAARESGVVLMIGQVLRFNQPSLAFARAIQEGAIGRPVLWRIVTAGAGPSSPWYLEHEQGGGPLMDGAIHNYDLARYTFGEPRSVYAVGHHFRPDRTAFDTATAVITFQSGDEMVLSWSWGMPAGVTSASGDVIGPEGVLLTSIPASAPDRPADTAETGHLAILRSGGQYEYRAHGKNDLFGDEIQAFTDAVLGGLPSPVSGEDNIRSLAIACAVLESAATGRVMEL
ncbi:MAG: Gfo/Idh/MocA family oxidoreductase [Armatimonadetes bacterium]|nr:Gfo/Idh/MocA family oxidoreductase [Armatimonadota bacterium]